MLNFLIDLYMHRYVLKIILHEIITKKRKRKIFPIAKFQLGARNWNFGEIFSLVRCNWLLMSRACQLLTSSSIPPSLRCPVPLSRPTLLQCSAWGTSQASVPRFPRLCFGVSNVDRVCPWFKGPVGARTPLTLDFGPSLWLSRIFDGVFQWKGPKDYFETWITLGV